ncbi:uncharacterized protein LOC112557596 isoform X2 [Pomacea canaliculata]|uniref:uncharacterized protein LOC112557596 isoform X2 n=1 Tax=Pomacea canaliculata TaxID=400727 RepID=UPI000D72F625|nr:uncharacterized protein LOC112557596 isoform X2 [Pomacea canaliculata]
MDCRRLAFVCIVTYVLSVIAYIAYTRLVPYDVTLVPAPAAASISLLLSTGNLSSTANTTKVLASASGGERSTPTPTAAPPSTGPPPAASSSSWLWSAFAANTSAASQDGVWQAVDDNSTFVYSAYHDDVSTPVVRVIAIVAEGLQDSSPRCLYFARFPPPPSGPFATRTATVQFVPEPKWGYKYRSAAVICPLEAGDRPQAVSVVPPTWRESQGQQPLNVVHVHWRTYSSNLLRNLTRCNPALHSSLTASTPLVEMFTFNRHFGTEHFVMYSLKVGDQEQRVLDLYRSRGQLDLYQWNLPVPASDIHYFGQLANIQDCIYRNLHVSRFVMFGDVDEILVPRSTSSLLTLAWMWLVGRPNCGSLQFYNIFFPLQQPDTDIQFPHRPLAEKYRMNTFLKTQAMATGTSRQKMIIDPTRVEISGIHDIEVFRPGFTRCRVQHSEGESEVNHLKRNHLPVDTFLHRYTDVIVTVASELTTLGYT